MKRTPIATSLFMAFMLLAATVAGAAEDKTAAFVNDLYERFAFRAPSSREVSYWSDKVMSLTPEAAELKLKNFFFVHAAYKTICDKTVSIDDVEPMVEMLNSGQLTYQAVQWSLFHSDEYKLAKAQGRVGQLMNPAFRRPL